jgi:RHS repeat-associated protein
MTETRNRTNRLTTITGTPTATLTHDAGGNIITEGTRTFTYDLTNRLTAITDNETQIASYVYDANNLRVKKTTPAETRIFHYDVNGHLIAETDGTGVTLAEHVYLSDMPLATVRPTDTVYYFHTDHINTPRVMTNSAGTVAWQAAYHGFGHAEVAGSSTITNNLRFPGQYFDSETNLHYNWNRYYDPRTGRYLTPDPIGLEGGIDPYVYTENQPINRTDKEGLAAIAIPPLLIYGPPAIAILAKTITEIVKRMGTESPDKCDSGISCKGYAKQVEKHVGVDGLPRHPKPCSALLACLRKAAAAGKLSTSDNVYAANVYNSICTQDWSKKYPEHPNKFPPFDKE